MSNKTNGPHSRLFPILNAGFAQHDGDWNWQNVRSPFARIYCVTEGEAQLEIHGPDAEPAIVRLDPRHLYYVPPFTRHSCRCEGRFAHFYIHISEIIDSTMGVYEEWDIPYAVPKHESDDALFRELCQLMPGRRLPASDPRTYDTYGTMAASVASYMQGDLPLMMSTQGIVNLIIAHFLQSPQARHRTAVRNDAIAQTVTYIRRHLDEDLTVARLAGIACMSSDHFIRKFRQETGLTPLKYITKQKMELAEWMLATTRLTTAQIADRLGFFDGSHFTRIFRQKTGTTPQQYRQDSGVS